MLKVRASTQSVGHFATILYSKTVFIVGVIYMGKRKEVKETVKNARIMFEEIKHDKNRADFYEENGVSHIEINLSNGNIYDEYSTDSELNPEIFDFVEKVFRLVKKKANLEIDITYPSEMSEEEKDKIEKLFKSHYAISIVKSDEEIKKHNIVSILLLIFGVLIYGAYGLLEYFKVDFVFQGIIEIASWVFIWEAVDMFFLSNFGSRIVRIKNVKIFNAKINRVDKNKSDVSI